MKYEDLNTLHLEMVRKQDEWLTQLVKASYALRQVIDRILSPPGHGDSAGQATSYVRVAKVSQGKAPERLTLNDRQANADGVFVFGLIITFESGPSTHQKTDEWLSIGVKIKGGGPQYCVWDLESDSPKPGNQWIITAEKAGESIIAYFAEYLTFDPETHFSNKQRLGFY